MKSYKQTVEYEFSLSNRDSVTLELIDLDVVPTIRLLNNLGELVQTITAIRSDLGTYTFSYQFTECTGYYKLEVTKTFNDKVEIELFDLKVTNNLGQIE